LISCRDEKEKEQHKAGNNRRGELGGKTKRKVGGRAIN